MKIRQGFVSNSSSSSYTCVVCCEEAGGWDCSPGEVGMMECITGHIFCEGHVNEVTLDMDAIRKYCLEQAENREEQERISDMDNEELKEQAEEMECPLVENSYECPSSYCPICSFKNARTWDTYRYLLKKYNLTEEQLLSDLKKEFENYDKFLEFLNKKD